MENTIIPFAYQNSVIRTFVLADEVWWVAADVCAILDLKNTSKALDGLADDEKGITNCYTPGGEQGLLTINEPGLYRLIFNSRKPEAEKFRRWVFHEVLPQLRKTGSYSTTQSHTPSGDLGDRLDRAISGIERVMQVQSQMIEGMTRMAEMMQDVMSRGLLSAPVEGTSRLQAMKQKRDRRKYCSMKSASTEIVRIPVNALANVKTMQAQRRASLHEQVPYGRIIDRAVDELYRAGWGEGVID